MAAALRDLAFAWGNAYAFGACDNGHQQVWTAMRQDDLGYLVAASADEMLHLIRRDDRKHPGRRREGRDPLLERLRAQFPGWAVIEAADEFAARRGWTELRAPLLGALRAQLHDRKFEDARMAALGARG